jgi:hypothetical protein
VLRKPLAAAVGAAIAFCAFAVSAPRRGAAASACSDTAGVTVIVDFTHFGGAIERGCDPDQAANALDAMHTAGFTTAGTLQYGDEFVCRIDALPPPKSEGCNKTPPADASWSFYYARPTDSTWTYSGLSVLRYHPPPGTMIAFAFGRFARPGVLPSGAAVPTTTTTTTTTASERPSPRTTPRVIGQVHPPVTAAPSAITPPPITAGVVAAPTAPPTTVKTKHPSTTRPDTATTRPARSTTTVPRIVDKTASGPVAGGDGGSGSPWPALLTVALIAGLGAGAFATVRVRRRRAT